MRYVTLSVLVFSASFAHAQLEVPVKLVLTGDTPEDRQVLGLADPISVDAAVSVDALRANAVSYAEAVGTSILEATLIPAPPQYVAGMVVNIVPQEANLPGAQINLNGLGTRPIVKLGELALDSADLNVGVPARMVYDGERFLLLSTVLRPCPAGYSAMNRFYCIEDVASEPSTFFSAIEQCATRNARLCSFTEWARACRSTPGFLSTVLDMEWVDHAGNNNDDAKTLGTGYQDYPAQTTTEIACEYGSNRQPFNLHPFRCCLHR